MAGLQLNQNNNNSFNHVRVATIPKITIKVLTMSGSPLYQNNNKTVNLLGLPLYQNNNKSFNYGRVATIPK